MRRAIFRIALVVFVAQMAWEGITASLTSKASPQAPTQTAIVSASTPRSRPTPTENPCFRWNEINDSMLGQEVCVYGTVVLVDSGDNVATRIEFSNERNSFFLLSSQYTFADLHRGDCVQAIGAVLAYETVLYMNIGSDLFSCY